MDFVGRDTTGERMEVFEVRDHPYFVGAQVPTQSYPIQSCSIWQVESRAMETTRWLWRLRRHRSMVGMAFPPTRYRAW